MLRFEPTEQKIIEIFLEEKERVNNDVAKDVFIEIQDRYTDAIVVRLKYKLFIERLTIPYKEMDHIEDLRLLFYERINAITAPGNKLLTEV